MLIRELKEIRDLKLAGIPDYHSYCCLGSQLDRKQQEKLESTNHQLSSSDKSVEPLCYGQHRWEFSDRAYAEHDATPVVDDKSCNFGYSNTFCRLVGFLACHLREIPLGQRKGGVCG
jgi:hypothetical protein